MQGDDKVMSIRQFVVCQSEGCHEAISIHHKDHFKDYHFDSHGGKKSTHKSVPFDESLEFMNFQAIGKLYDIVFRKIEESMKGLDTDADAVAQTALYRSAKFKQFFQKSDQALSEYFYLLQLSRKNPMPKYPCFSADFCSVMSIPNEKAVHKLYKELCQNTAEWQYLNIQFNYASGINSDYLQSFIGQEQVYFAYYCNRIIEEKKEFEIRNYLAERGSVKEYVNDVYYYSPQFVTFLEQKYQRNPGDEEMFNLKEYYLHFWKYFFVVVDNSKNVAKYFQEEVEYYKQYEVFMHEQKLKQSFLSFRMWRLNRKTSTYLPSLKNPFFLQTFIYSFIEGLIIRKLFYAEKKRNYDFKLFIGFLHDYVQFIQEKSEEFSFSRYWEYYQFRKVGQKFEDMLKKNSDIVFDKVFFIEYAHNQFAEENKLAVKKYRKYQEKRSQEEDEKMKQTSEKIDILKNELMQQYKNEFYHMVWNSFISEVTEKKTGLSLEKESYKMFRKQMLESVDQQYIQQSEAEYWQEMEEAQEYQKAEGKQRKRLNPKERNVLEEEIDNQEEYLAGMIHDEQKSEMSSDEQREMEENCPCCKGRPYNCQEPECKILGVCSSCMLGD